MSDLKSAILDSLTLSHYRDYFGQHLEKMGNMKSSGWVRALCPLHEDTNPSFDVNFLQQGAYRCHSCGQTGDLFTFHQKKVGGNFRDALKYFAGFVGIDPDSNPEYSREINPKKKKKLGALEATYQYVDLAGNIQYEELKYKDPKDFRQRRPHPDQTGKYLWNLKDIEIIPYNLPELHNASTVYFVEGPKDVERLKQIGIVATTNPMGAGKFWDSMTPYFQDKTVIILPDNDEPGKAHGQLVAAKIKSVAKSIHVVNLPNLPPGGDVSDWLAAGNTKADLLEIVDKKSNPYQDHIDYLNQRHACIRVGGKTLILNEEYDAIFDRQTITFSTEKDLRAWYANRNIPNPQAGERGQPKKINIVKDWMESPDRRSYDQLIFCPSGTPNGCYNYWTGFAVEPKQGDWSLFRTHILENICSGNKFYFDWMLQWMARIVQEPGGKRPGTSIVLRGERGVGKGVFVSQFGRLFGAHYVQINNQQHLTSRFNAHLKDVVLLFVDEGFWAGDKSAEGSIKGLITEDLLLIEAKGRDSIPLKNYINIMIASNSEWVVPTGFFERRFFCLDVGIDHQQDLPYFEAIVKQMQNGGRAAMMYDLLETEVNFERICRIPRTDALWDQTIASMSPVQKFWLEILRRGTLHPEDDDWTGEIRKDVLHKSYIDFCDEYNIRTRLVPIQFGRQIKKLFPPASNAGDRERYIAISGPNSCGKYVRKWAFCLPDLVICRDFFQKTVKMGVDFDSDEGFDYENGVDSI